MTTSAFRQALSNQFGASLSMLGYCIAKCPDALWDAPVVKYPLFQVAFHTLIFADLYLEPNDESFRQQPYHLANPQLFRDYEQLEDREPVLFYERTQLTDYLEHCRLKAMVTIAAETDETLSAPAKFARKNFSRDELHLNNLRHIQHHTAQLTMRLRLDTDVDIPWLATV